MTANQTIDGVPRVLVEWMANSGELLELLGLCSGELRALLDAPAPTPTPVAWMRFDDDQKAIFTRSKRASKSEPLYAHPTAYRHTAPAAQPQGEPVAMFYIGDIDGYGCLYTQPQDGSLTLYAERPAPVAVVIPERSDFEKIAERECMERLGRFVPARSADGYRNQTTALLFAVWQRCLDEVTRLNAKSR